MTYKFNNRIKSNQLWAVFITGSICYILFHISGVVETGPEAGINRWTIAAVACSLVFLMFTLKQILLFGRATELNTTDWPQFREILDRRGFHLKSTHTGCHIYRKSLEGEYSSYRELVIEEDANSDRCQFFLNTYTFIDVCLFTQHYADMRELNRLISGITENADLAATHK